MCHQEILLGLSSSSKGIKDSNGQTATSPGILTHAALGLDFRLDFRMHRGWHQQAGAIIPMAVGPYRKMP